MLDQAKAEAFFNDYARASFDDDPNKLAALYAGSFIAAGPEGSAVFPNDDKFIEWLRGVREFNQRVGMTSLAQVDVALTGISDTHTLARVTWAATFEKTGETPVTFDITYLLEAKDDTPLVLAYVAHTSEEEEMKRLGLI